MDWFPAVFATVLHALACVINVCEGKSRKDTCRGREERLVRFDLYNSVIERKGQFR